MQSFKMIFSGVTILQGVEFPIFPIDFAWALQQCSATALPVMLLLRTRRTAGDGRHLKPSAFCDILLKVQHRLQDAFVTTRYEAHCTQYLERRDLRP